MENIDIKIKDALDNVRAAAQELHVAISDAAAKRGGATKADLEAFAQKAKAVTDSVKASIGAQNDATKKHLAEAVTALEATQKHAAEGLKSSGQAFQTSIKSPRRRTRFRSESQRSRCCKAFGCIQENQVGEFHAQLHRCGF